MRRIEEILVEGYLIDSGKTLEELRHEASDGLRKSLQGTKYEIPLKCSECGGKLLYSSKKEKMICAFCNHG